MPIQAQIAHHGPQPRRKLRGPMGFELMQPAKAFLAQTFAYELKTISRVIIVRFEVPNDMKDKR